MKTILISMTFSALFLAPCAVRADVAMPPSPPQEMVVKGSLSWDGEAEKKLLKLTTADKEMILLGSADKIKETKTGDPIIPEKYIGKKVTVTFIDKRMTQSVTTPQPRPRPHPTKLPTKVDVKEMNISLTLAKGI